jgi:hypothetical protein
MTRGCLLALALCAVLFVVVGADALVQKAQSAEEFADSVCVNTHFGYPESSWVANSTRLIELLAEAGIYNIRESNSEVGLELAARGIKMNYGLAELDWNRDSNISDTREFVREIKQVINDGFLIDAILNVNEPDLTWPSKNIVRVFSSGCERMWTNSGSLSYVADLQRQRLPAGTDGLHARPVHAPARGLVL